MSTFVHKRHLGFWFRCWQDYWWWGMWLTSWPLIALAVFWRHSDYMLGLSLGINVALLSYKCWAIGRDIHGHRQAGKNDSSRAANAPGSRTLHIPGGMAGIAQPGDEAGAGEDLAIEPIVAFRGWTLTGDGHLGSAHGDGMYQWPPRRALQAECSHHGNHVAPERKCGCGIYSVKFEPKIQASTGRYGGPFAWGRVATWGKVEEAEEGYRSEFAYPISITIVNGPYHGLSSQSGYSQGLSDEQLEILRASVALLYGVPVRVGTLEEFMAAKQASYEAMGLPPEVRELVG